MAEVEIDLDKHVKRLKNDLENINKWPHTELIFEKDVNLDKIKDIKDFIESQILILEAFKFILNDSGLNFISTCNDKLILLLSACKQNEINDYKLIFELNESSESNKYGSLEYISSQFGEFTKLIPVKGGKNTSKKSSKKKSSKKKGMAGKKTQ